MPEDARMSARGIEVGHIFYFGTKYSAPMKAVVNGPDGKERAGANGFLWHRRRAGSSARMIEASHDEAGIDLAGGGRAVRRRPDQSQGRRPACDARLRRALCALSGGHRRAL